MWKPDLENLKGKGPRGILSTHVTKVSYSESQPFGKQVADCYLLREQLMDKVYYFPMGLDFSFSLPIFVALLQDNFQAYTRGLIVQHKSLDLV